MLLPPAVLPGLPATLSGKRRVDETAVYEPGPASHAPQVGSARTHVVVEAREVARALIYERSEGHSGDRLGGSSFSISARSRWPLRRPFANFDHMGTPPKCGLRDCKHVDGIPDDYAGQGIALDVRTSAPNFTDWAHRGACRSERDERNIYDHGHRVERDTGRAEPAAPSRPPARLLRTY